MKRELLFFILLIVACTAVYYQSLSFNFTYLDDQVQVVNNTAIKSISWENIKHIFSSTTVGMYQPITTLIYALAYQISGLNPIVYGIFSLFFHLVNCLLIVKLLEKLGTKGLLNYFLVSLFALHPMQVESIVWVSAFSNLVFTTFFLLSMICFLSFNTQPSKKQLAWSLVFFILACFSKSMAITLPVVLVFYQLLSKRLKNINWLPLVPYFVVAIVFGLITIFSRESAGHLSDLSVQFNWIDRIFLISYSVLFYPLQFLFPFELSVFYPYPEIVNGALPWRYYVSLPLVLAIIYLLWRKRKSQQLVFGAGFYLISISLVLQLIPVGNQLTTDRYIYLPMLGLLLILAHFLSKMNQSLLFVLFIITAVVGFKSYQRTAIWENDGLIWKDVIEKYPRVAQAHNNLGSYLLTKNQKAEAFNQFNLAIKFKPYYADAYSNRGNLFAQQGQVEQALSDFNEAIKLRPHADAYFNRANIYAQQGKAKQAISDYSKSLELKKSADAYTNRAFVYLRVKAIDLALEDINQAIDLRPEFNRSYFLKGMAYQMKQNRSEACSAFKKAIELGSENAKAAYQDYCLNP